MNSFESILTALRSIAEESRLRIVSILLEGELTVTELSDVLGQSQPRVSRHLKILDDGGIIERYQEGSWVFYRLGNDPLMETLKTHIPVHDPVINQDLKRLEKLRTTYRKKASAFFEKNAAVWDQVRARFVPESVIEGHLLEIVGQENYRFHVDIGTGTGRMLQLFAESTRRAIGIDNSREMLSVARSNLAGASFRHCKVRAGDVYRLLLEDGCADLVTIHHVLHYLENPADAISEAARILAPDGLMIIVDYAPHRNEMFRSGFAHRRLGFPMDEIIELLRVAGLECKTLQTPGTPVANQQKGEVDTLRVYIWTATREPKPSGTPVGDIEENLYETG